MVRLVDSCFIGGRIQGLWDMPLGFDTVTVPSRWHWHPASYRVLENVRMEFMFSAMRCHGCKIQKKDACEYSFVIIKLKCVELNFHNIIIKRCGIIEYQSWGSG